MRKFWILIIAILIFWGCAQLEYSKNNYEKYENVAREFVKGSPTFSFDGIEQTLKLKNFTKLDCKDCWEFWYEFECRQAGYGNRSGQLLAQVITKHVAKIVIKGGKIVEAVLDNTWDELNQRFIE